MKRFLYLLLSRLLTFIGDIKFFGWNKPFWFVVNSKDHKLTGEHYREVIKLIIPGDIVLSRSEKYVDKWLIPGFWTHAGFYFGGEKNQVIHSVSDGVVIEDIINFMRTDELIVLRPKGGYQERAIALAQSMINREYDFLFNFDDNNRLSCTELIFCCYPKFISPKKRFGKYIVVADDIANSKHFQTVWTSLVP